MKDKNKIIIEIITKNLYYSYQNLVNLKKLWLMNLRNSDDNLKD